MSRDCCQRLRGKSGGGGGGAGRCSCYICGELGHLARDCCQRVVGKYTAGTSGGGLRSCFVCGEPGHLARDCHRRASPKYRAGGSGRGRCCFVCGKPGHLAMNCYQRVGGKCGAGGGGVRPCCVCREPEGLTPECYQIVGGNYVDDGSPNPPISSSSNEYDEKGVGEEEEEEKRVDDENLSNGNYRSGESRDTNGEMRNLSRKIGWGPIVIEISSSSSSEDEEEKEWVVGKKSTGSLDVKMRVNEEKRREEEEDDDEDCVILDFDPFQPPTIDLMNKVSLSSHHLSVLPDEDISVISERGQVACRDYPHSRHHCAEYPFSKTAHESCCPQCYCYVCDVVAPCEFWEGSCGHCHASDHEDGKWIARRMIRRFSLVGDLGESYGYSSEDDS